MSQTKRKKSAGDGERAKAIPLPASHQKAKVSPRKARASRGCEPFQTPSHFRPIHRAQSACEKQPAFDSSHQTLHPEAAVRETRLHDLRKTPAIRSFPPAKDRHFHRVETAFPTALSLKAREKSPVRFLNPHPRSSI